MEKKRFGSTGNSLIRMIRIVFGKTTLILYLCWVFENQVTGFVSTGTFENRHGINVYSWSDNSGKSKSSQSLRKDRKSIMSVKMAGSAPPQKVVIAGAGVIGTSTAYYLATEHSIPSITLVDPSGSVAPAASGKAGGFLALDWNDYSPVRHLARRSFALHEQLAADLGGEEKIMYRRLTCAAISVDESSNRRPTGKKLQGVEWADGETHRDTDDQPSSSLVRDVRILGDESTIAQVHPKMLCEALWEKVTACESVDASLVKGKVLEPLYSQHDQLIGAKLQDGTTLEADAILFACGPWTTKAIRQTPMLGVKYHSVLIPTRPKILTQSVFFNGFGDPEVYPRPDGTAYCTGFPDNAIVVTEEPGKEEVRSDAVDRIVQSVRKASGGALNADPELTQSCYLPTTLDNLPIMGELPSSKGCFVAAGHGCWGILMGPGTGETMASLIATGQTTPHVQLEPFSPSRFDTLL